MKNLIQNYELYINELKILGLGIKLIKKCFKSQKHLKSVIICYLLMFILAECFQCANEVKTLFSIQNKPIY